MQFQYGVRISLYNTCMPYYWLRRSEYSERMQFHLDTQKDFSYNLLDSKIFFDFCSITSLLLYHHNIKAPKVLYILPHPNSNQVRSRSTDFPLSIYISLSFFSLLLHFSLYISSFSYIQNLSFSLSHTVMSLLCVCVCVSACVCVYKKSPGAGVGDEKPLLSFLRERLVELRWTVRES